MIKSIFKILIGLILTYNAILAPVLTYGANGTIQTTAEQIGGNRQKYLLAPSIEISTEVVDARTRWNGYASTTGTYMVVSDTNLTIPLDPGSQRFFILSYTGDSATAVVKYTNQNGTERTISTWSASTVIVNGSSYQLFKMASTTAGDTTARNIKWLISRRYVLFTSLTSENLPVIVTDEASTYTYMDQLNSEFFSSIYTPINILASEILSVTQPTTGTTTASGTVPFSFIFYNALSGTQVNSYSISPFDRITSQYLTPTTELLPAGTFGSVNTTITLPAGTYTATISLFDNTLTPQLDRSPTDITFNVITNPAGIIGITDFNNLTGIATTTCSITNIAGCMQNALLFVFYPSVDVLNKFGEIKDLIATKPPFGYIAVTAGQLANVSASGVGSFTLATENNIKTLIFDPLRSGLANILYFCFGLWFLDRIRKQEL